MLQHPSLLNLRFVIRDLDFRFELLTWTLDFGIGLWTRTLDLDLDCDNIVLKILNIHAAGSEERQV